MFPRALRIGSIGGVDIRVDPSWLVIAAIVALDLWVRFGQVYGHSASVAAVLAAAGSLLFFASVLAHELAHALEARHRGVTVGGITLFLFGGVTETRFDVERPRDEFVLSAVGPYVSFVVAALMGLIATAASYLGWSPIADLTGLLAWLNALLGAFNLVPGAPLDGGRVLRSIVWALTGDRARAVRVSARSGQAIAAAMVLLGVGVVFLDQRLLFSGLWGALIGWFLFRAASAELERSETVDALRGLTAGALVHEAPPALPAGAELVAVLPHLTRSASDVHPVIESNGQVVGVLRVTDVAAVAGRDRGTTLVRHAMCPFEDVVVVDPATAVATVLDRMERTPAVAVVDDGDLTGLLSAAGFETALARARTLHGERAVGATPRRSGAAS